MSPTQADTSLSDATVIQQPNAELTPCKDVVMINSQTLSDDDFASFEEVKQPATSQNPASVAITMEKEELDEVSSPAVKIQPPGGSSEVKEEAEGGSSPQVQDVSQENRYVHSYR